MTKTEASELVRKHGSLRAAARATGIDRKKLGRIINAKQGGAMATAKTAEKPVEQANKKGKSLAQFRATYDKATIIPTKIRAALKGLSTGWEYESEFVRRAEISFTDLGNYRDQFADYCVLIKSENKRAWSGSLATAKAMREML